MLKAVIFDCFGVLTTEGLTPFINTYFGDSPDKEHQADALTDEVNLNHISYHEFIRRLAELANVPVSVAWSQIDANTANAELFDFIKSELKPKYKIGMLSNAAHNWINELFTPDQAALFDMIALSCEINAIKPNPKAYLTASQLLNVKPEECLLIDDVERYCTAARAFGMTAIYYQSFKQFKASIKPLITN